MKNLIMSVVLVLTLAVPAFSADSKIVDHLQAISVTVVSNTGSGSGVIKTRLRGQESVNFVFTAAHVVDGLRKTRTVVDKNGVTRTLVEFEDAKIVKTLVEDGRNVGKLEIFAEVVRYNEEEDLALLRVRQKNFLKDGVEFRLEDKPVAIGVHLFHVGSLLGEIGSNSFTDGLLSQQGRLINGKIFDQTTCAAFPGSSGGGVYTEDGKLVGMVLRGAGETFNLIVPSRRIVAWAKSANVEWAVNDAVPLPDEVALKKIPVEDVGVSFSAAERSAQRKSSTTIKTMFHIIESK